MPERTTRLTGPVAAVICVCIVAVVVVGIFVALHVHYREASCFGDTCFSAGLYWY